MHVTMHKARMVLALMLPITLAQVFSYSMMMRNFGHMLTLFPFPPSLSFRPLASAPLTSLPPLQDRRAEEGQEGDVQGRPQGQEGADGEEEARSPVGRRGRVLDVCSLPPASFFSVVSRVVIPFLLSCHLPSTRTCFGSLRRRKRRSPCPPRPLTGSALVAS